MWLALALIIVVILVALGGLVAGGIYAAVLIPIAVIVLLGGLIAAMWRRSSDPSRRVRRTEEQAQPAHSPGHNAAAAPSTPDDLVNARQQSQ